jgi:hypothetical protein
VSERNELDALHGDLPDPPAPMLQMDGIRIATLVMLGVHTIAVIVLSVFLVTSAQNQRLTNECYQRQIVALIDWAQTAVDAGRTDRQAQRELLLSRAATDTDRQTVLDRYLAQLDEADRTRQTVPVPEQRCTR